MGRVSPNFHRPEHFAGYASRLEAAPGGGIRVVFAAPPQHGKTEVTIHGLVWIALRFPKLRHAYITYAQKRANRVAKKVRNLLATCGVVVSGTIEAMELPGGGQIIFTSIDGGLTGDPVDGIAIVDDYFKNRKEADSQNRRDVVVDAYRQVIETRVHPAGSIVVLATRWHPRDLSGVLKDEESWEYINLPAIAENDNDPNGRAIGEPLFKKMWPLEALQKKRTAVGEFAWASLYEGRPRPRGGKVFHDPTYYSKLPEHYRGGFGIDLAYTAKTNADWSICLEMWEERRPGLEPLYYVIRVDRAQVEAPSFALTLRARSAKRPGWKMLWRSSGTEKGAAQFLVRQKLPVIVRHPPGDKFVSATEAAAAWNEGRILVPDPERFPECHAWLEAFLGVVGDFTGNGKEVDDDVDALGNAIALFGISSKGAGVGGGSRSGDRIV